MSKPARPDAPPVETPVRRTQRVLMRLAEKGVTLTPNTLIIRKEIERELEAAESSFREALLHQSVGRN